MNKQLIIGFYSLILKLPQSRSYFAMTIDLTLFKTRLSATI